ncbi:hypothetical protein RhiirA4_471750 [Rhizophagus irregularis]|uniref:Uncharacterized protein n=1 Tax=Rhizophagus irregularis TaxID=588596 RepID=A0A2I1H3Q1_9GLOM|nr:hypothetical protein RhiirA4_471750 [Rhizophagus irregularis]
MTRPKCVLTDLTSGLIKFLVHSKKFRPPHPIPRTHKSVVFPTKPILSPLITKAECMVIATAALLCCSNNKNDKEQQSSDLAIHWYNIVKHKNLRVNLTKVKANSNNTFNDMADELAKARCDLPNFNQPKMPFRITVFQDPLPEILENFAKTSQKPSFLITLHITTRLN